MTRKPLQIKLKIDWSELDLFGHVNNVMFYKYIQSARVRFWQQIELYDMYKKKGVAPLLASATIDFKKPLLYPGNAIINYAPAFIKNTSFGLEYSILDNNNDITALGRDTMVLYDFNQSKKLIIPDNLRMNIEKLK